MNIDLLNIFRVFIAVAITSFFYWEVFHRVCIRALRFKLFALRDDLRRGAAENKIGNSKEYKELEQFICVVIAYIPNVSLTSFALSNTPTLSPQEREAFEKFERDAPEEFVRIRFAACKCAFTIMMLNSPWLIALSSFAVLPLWAMDKISGAAMAQRTRAFISNLPPAPHLKLPSARIA
jgi:hypothetical protein